MPYKEKQFKNCKRCGGKFRTYAYYEKKGRGIFCSNTCRLANAVENGLKELNEGRKKAHDFDSSKFGRPSNKITVKCRTCKKEYLVHPSTPINTCSKECSSVQRKTLKVNLGKKIPSITGENHYAWVKDRSLLLGKRVSKEYKLWRKEVLERDNNTCVKCGYVSCKKGDIHCDHIKPVILFPHLANNIDNGRVLCAKCHYKTKSYGKTRYHYTKPNEQVALKFKNIE